MRLKSRQGYRGTAAFLLVVHLLALATEIVAPAGRTALASDVASASSRDGGLLAALSTNAAATLGSSRTVPGAQITSSPATAARLQAQLAEAEAILAEAELRLQQAQSGQGGLGARPEDIAAAEARVGAAQVALRLRQPFDDVRLLRGPILLFDGMTRAATELRDGCGDLDATTRIYLDDQEIDTKLHIGVNCPDERRDALDAAIDVQKALRTIAEQDLKRFTDPSPQVQNFLVPYEQDVRKAELEVQKLRTGGPRDLATLELNVVRAQADVDALKAAMSGSIPGMLQAQLTRAEAELKDALYRVEQAKTGQGGVDVRAEDIAAAEADVATAKANLALFLNPIGEDVEKARAAVEGAEAAERLARKTVDACGKGKVTIRLRENDDGDISFLEFVRERLRDRVEELGPRERLRQRAQDALEDRRPPHFEIELPGLPPILIDFLRKQLLERLRDRIEDRLAELKGKIEELKGRIVRTRELIAATKEAVQDLEVELNEQCTGEYKDELEALTDEAVALKKIAEQQLKLLTNPSPQQIAHYVIPLQQAVVIAEARLQKLKTGGVQDEVTLQRNVARAQADVDGLKAVLGGSVSGLYRAQLSAAQAELAEAEARIQQAQAGNGGLGARAEDIQMAEAGLVAAEEALQIIVDPLPELIAVAKAGVDAADAAVRVAQQRRKACDRLLVIGTTRIDEDNDNGDDEELPEKTFSSQSCSDDLKQALNHAIARARAEKTVAELALKKLTNPSEKLVSYLTEPAIQAITIATARLQELKSGGLLDQQALELRRARAQAEVSFWQAAVNGSPPGQIQAQIQAAQADLKDAEYRQAQAKNGQGGTDARPEDIAMAEAALAIANISLTELLNPAPENVLSAEAAVTAALAGVDEARKRRDACDDASIVSVRKEDRDDDDPSTRRESHITCPGGVKEAMDAEVDVARADLEIAEMQFQLLTAPAMPQIQYVITPYQQAVVIAEARVRKLKTGGSQDDATLERNVRTARASVDRYQAALVGSAGGIVMAWIASAQALVDEAQFRVTQAQNGQGGRDARAEDITIAEAEARAAEARFMAIVNPLEETVQTARANLKKAEANVRAAEGRRRACREREIVGQEKVEGKSGDRRTVTEANCSDNTREALNWGIEHARIERGIAFQQLKLLTDPGEPQILYVIAPSQQAAMAAAANVQKQRTGGNADEATLQLQLALAQADLGLWQALAENNPTRLLESVIGGTMAAHATAQARQAQAQAGQGGPGVRAEDIAMAEANYTARGAELQQALDPPQETVESARLAILSNEAQTERARYLKQACGDLELTTTFREGEDKDGDPKEEPLKLKTDLDCPDHQEDALRALEEGIEGFRLVPIALYSLLTDLATNEKLQVLVAGRKAEVAVAEAELQKAKTGGNADESSLQLAVTVTGAAVQCWQAFAVEASQGALPQQQQPYAWTVPNPCSLSQLPGKLPGFMQQNVTVAPATP